MTQIEQKILFQGTVLLNQYPSYREHSYIYLSRKNFSRKVGSPRVFLNASSPAINQKCANRTSTTEYVNIVVIACLLWGMNYLKPSKYSKKFRIYQCVYKVLKLVTLITLLNFFIKEETETINLN